MKSPNANPLSEAEQLIFQYLDGTANASEVQELNRLLKQDKTLLQRFALLSLQEVHLDELGQEGRLSVPAAQTNPQPVIRLSILPRCREWLRGKVTLRPARALGMACLLTLGLLLWRQIVVWRSPRLSAVDGTVWIERGTKRQTARAQAQIRVHDLIVLQPGASATLQFGHELTCVRLTDEARVELHSMRPGKTLVLQFGSLCARVARQSPHQPMRFITPQSEAEVIGTEFKFTVSTNTTRLAVWNGSVRIRDAKGVSATVSRGALAIVSAGLPLRIEALQGGVLREAWRDLSGSRISDLTGSPRFPDRPTERSALSALELKSTLGDAYGLRLRGWLHVPREGPYRFWVAADDVAELWLSRDETSAHLKRICFTPEFSAPREWDKHPQQRSEPIQLCPGREYYIEVLMKQSGGQDDLAVGWDGPALSRDVIPGEYLAPTPVDILRAATPSTTP